MVNKFIYTLLASTLALGIAGESFAAAEDTAAKQDAAAPAKTEATDKKDTAAPDSAKDTLTFEQKASIAMGTLLSKQIDETVKFADGYDIAIDKQAIIDSFNKAADGQPEMTEEQVKTTMTELQQKVQSVDAEKAKAIAAENSKKGAAFLAENAKKDGVKTTASGLQYKIEKEGTGAKPTANDMIEVNYKGYTIDNKVFDESKDKPMQLRLDQVIKGWTEAFQLFPVGTKATLYIPAKLAYGESSPTPLIQPNSVIIFDVELVSIVKPEADKKPAADAKSNKK